MHSLKTSCTKPWKNCGYRLALLLALFLSACSSSKEECARARIHLAQDPVTLDPRSARDMTSVQILHMIGEGLTRFSKEGKIEQALAKEIAISEDGLCYTLRLKPSRWSDGSPLVAADFVRD